MGLLERLTAWLRGPPPEPPRTWTFVDDAEWQERLSGDFDFATAQVYGDWLEERGDTRAELIRAAGTPGFDDFVRSNARSMLAELAPAFLEEVGDGARRDVDLEWRFGVLVGFALRGETPWERLPQLRWLPIARHLRRLALAPGRPHTRGAEAGDFDTLTHFHALDDLFVGDFEYPTECEMSWAELGDLSTLWRAVPKLKRLKLRGLVRDFGVIELPALTHFTWETSGHARQNLASLLDARLPKLEHLELWFGDPNYGAECSVDDVRPLLHRDLPLVTSLGLKNFEFTDGLVEPLLGSPLLPRLRRLDLSLGCLTDEGADELLRGRARLSHLEVLDLSRNVLSDAHFAELKTLCREVRLEGQRRDEMDDDMRYVAVGE